MPKKAPAPKHRPIYDRSYYQAIAMLRDPWFAEKIAWLRKRLAETGCPLPKRPFKKYSQYLDWNKKFWDRYAALEKSPEMAAARTRITGDKPVMSEQEFYALEDFKGEFLPPLYGEVFDEILQHFNINPSDRSYRDFLERHLFFGDEVRSTEPFKVSWRRSDLKGPFELTVQIFGHTKREDFLHYWDWIAAEQKRLPDFIGKNKAWKTFDRDMEVCDLFKELRAKSKVRRAVNTLESIDTNVYTKLHKKYPELTLQGIRSIVSRTPQRLGES